MWSFTGLNQQLQHFSTCLVLATVVPNVVFRITFASPQTDVGDMSQYLQSGKKSLIRPFVPLARLIAIRILDIF